ncbi:PpiC-type peptidyl-prolyl cis-trans isomerase [Paraburkholderia ribeironis]|uniref:peptidylprolyl isomerase n=1 Tax=Paraburkholderia ribeironis TaxID=1247936 RepID=A0A1N7RKJ5_9BURK|nr:peptidyl-prolyl cis-trans isomerase [Paraburkholderia ribeironis]SIT35584.1 PpiC-type peptidyl-prolyl cis-trans isomerase [Paraburkholderia ribeironis]
MSFMTTTIRSLCVTAFASVALGTLVPAIAHAADPAGGTLPAGTVAIVNGVAIPQAKLDDAIKASRQPDTQQLRQAIRQQLIVAELFRQGAEKGHYDTKPEVVQAMSAAKVNAETQLYLRDNIQPEPVTDAQVKARYDAIVASLGKEEYKPRVITVADDATAAVVLSKLKAGGAFDALARQYSVAPTKTAGGELPWVSFRTPVKEGNTQGLPLPVAQAITQLRAGGVTPAPIPAGQGANAPRVIVKLDAKRPTQVPAFDQAKDAIRQQLQALALEKAAAQFSGSLITDSKIVQ